MEAQRREVEQMIEQERPFDAIEERIDGMSLTDDEKAALWLLAWSEQDRPARSRVVGEALALATQPQG